MGWSLSSDRPIYNQIVDVITRRIVSGEYSAGQKLPSVRDLAEEAAVNPNTMQKALSELERSGLVYAQRTSGRFITEDKTMLENTKMQIAKEYIEEFIAKMQQLGYDKDTIINMIQSEQKEA